MNVHNYSGAAGMNVHNYSEAVGMNVHNYSGAAGHTMYTHCMCWYWLQLGTCAYAYCIPQKWVGRPHLGTRVLIEHTYVFKA